MSIKAKKSRKHKKYTSRPVDAGAIDRAIVNGQLLGDTQVSDIILHARLAFEVMRKGKSSEENWVTVACAMNMACVFCEIGIGADYRPDLVAALEACWRVKLRAVKTGSWVFDGAGMQAVAFALDLHDEQIKIATCGQVKFAIEEIRRRVLADEVYKNVEHLDVVQVAA